MTNATARTILAAVGLVVGTTWLFSLPLAEVKIEVPRYIQVEGRLDVRGVPVLPRIPERFVLDIRGTPTVTVSITPEPRLP